MKIRAEMGLSPGAAELSPDIWKRVRQCARAARRNAPVERTTRSAKEPGLEIPTKKFGEGGRSGLTSVSASRRKKESRTEAEPVHSAGLEESSPPIVETSQSAAERGRRVALVIGNGAYQHVPHLSNPPNDASDIGDALQRLGFSVIRLQDANAEDMKRSFEEFGQSAEQAQIAIVFYAGHGVEANGENWLIPTDATLANLSDAPNEAISVRLVNTQVSRAHELGLIILDACRNNPFTPPVDNVAVSPTVTVAGRSPTTRSIGTGLAPAQPSANVLIAFSAKDGTVANDGEGRNSPFTKSLLANIETQGLEISSMFRKIRDETVLSTHDSQQPYVYGSLSSVSIYLKPPAAVYLFDGPWKADYACEPSGLAGRVREKFIAIIKNGRFTGYWGAEGEPGSTKFEGNVDADGTLRIVATGLTGAPKNNIGNSPSGRPFFFRLDGTLEKDHGTAIRTAGRPCRMDFSLARAGK